MTKRVDLSFTIDLPDGHSAEKVSITPDGKVKVFDKMGAEITPAHIERGVHYERVKGKKYQTRTFAVDKHISIGGLEELAKLESLIVVDTNSAVIEDTKVSAAFFFRVKLVVEGDKFSVISLDQCGHVYEFHNIPDCENPEMLAILKIANDVLQHEIIVNNPKIGFVTDSEMGSHVEISTQQQTIYGKHNLPEGFGLIYASSDTGRELINWLMRFSDQESSKYLERLKQGAFKKTGLAVLKEDQSVQFRYTYYPSLSIVNPLVEALSIGSETQSTILFQ